MRYKMVPTKNVLMLGTALEALRGRDTSVPGLGLIHGRSGYGKTMAIATLAARERAVYIRAHSAITLSSLLDMLCFELGADPGKGKSSAKFNTICNVLQSTPDMRTICVDEGDYLLRDTRILDILRDIHDTVRVPVVLVGMEGITMKLRHRPQFSNRISQFIEFKAADLDDTRLTTESLCEISISEDLLQLMHRKTQGCMRDIVVALSNFERFAKDRRLKELDLATWGDRKMILQDTGGVV